MSSTSDILRKKIRPRPVPVAPCVDWWQSNGDQLLRHVCKTFFALDIEVTELKGRQAAAPDALAGLTEVALPFLLNTNAERLGLFVLDGTLIDGLIEQQLLGKILPTKRLDRPVTSIDAGLSEGFVKSVLTALDTGTMSDLTKLSLKSVQQDRAELRLALGAGDYDILEAEINMGPGVKSGSFQLLIPASPPVPKAKPPRKANPHMLALLQECEVDLKVDMPGCVATAKQLLELKADVVLRMPKSSLSKVRLTDCNGKKFATGKLGQLNGSRAVRLTSLSFQPPKPFTHVSAPAIAEPSLPDAKLEEIAVSEPPSENEAQVETKSEDMAAQPA